MAIKIILFFFSDWALLCRWNRILSV